MSDARRAQSCLPSADDGLGDGDGKEKVGLANVVVIEEIGSVGAEVVGVEDPPAKWDGDSELMFFVSLAVEFDKSEIVGGGKLQQRAGGRDERGRLVVMAVEGAEGPVEARDVEGNAEAGADGIF